MGRGRSKSLGRLKIGVLVSGQGSNLQAIIDASEQGEIRSKVEIVVSNNPCAYALKRAERHAIPAIYIDPKDFKDRRSYEEEITKHLKAHKVDLVCLAGYMLLVTPYFVSQFKDRTMNIHPSLLPSFPGLDAQRKALEYGVKITGCTIHFVDEGCDTGPIILQRAVKVLPDDSIASLSERILKEEQIAYKEAIRLFEDGRLKIIGRVVKIL